MSHFELKHSVFINLLARLKRAHLGPVCEAQRVITVKNPALNLEGKACGYACVLLQGECGVITSRLFHARSVSECVLPDLGVGRVHPSHLLC